MCSQSDCAARAAAARPLALLVLLLPPPPPQPPRPNATPSAPPAPPRSRKWWIALALVAMLCSAPLIKAQEDAEGEESWEDASDEETEFVEAVHDEAPSKGGGDVLAELTAAFKALTAGDVEPIKELAAKFFAVAQEHGQVRAAAAAARLGLVPTLLRAMRMGARMGARAAMLLLHVDRMRRAAADRAARGDGWQRLAQMLWGSLAPAAPLSLH